MKMGVQWNLVGLSWEYDIHTHMYIYYNIYIHNYGFNRIIMGFNGDFPMKLLSCGLETQLFAPTGSPFPPSIHHWVVFTN
jgi:hypothetical protein